MSHVEEVKRGVRYSFGENWARFLALLDDEKIRLAERSLRDMLEIATFEGKSFLDVGSGSGLFSLSARRLGARVHSFDYDSRSVACTLELKRKFFDEDPLWVIEEGSALDQGYLSRLGQFDYVYSWGVLHHTGNLWAALANIEPLVGPNGRLLIAVYNDQGRSSRRWLAVKRAYNKLPVAFRWLIVLPALVRLWGPTMLRDLMKLDPLGTWRDYGKRDARGMDPWRDSMDWIGGLPFEVAKPEAIFDFFHKRGFHLRRLRTCAGGIGCNEFVFDRSAMP